MSNILYTQAAAQAMAAKIEELVDKVYDLEVQLAREKHKNERPVNRCPEVWPDLNEVSNAGLIITEYLKR